MLQEKVEVTMRRHDLRHFAVSLWIEQSFSIDEVMTFAGPSSLQMTMERYGHLFPTARSPEGHGHGLGEAAGVIRRENTWNAVMLAKPCADRLCALLQS